MISAPKLTHSAMVANISHVYSLSTASERTDGKLWYPRAHAIVVDWADFYGRSIANVACIIAALSPQVEWTRNLIVAEDVLRGIPPSIGGTIQRFLRIAERIRDERASDTVDYFKNGCKVRSFAVNLAGNFDVVTVDTHAAQIAAGSPLSDLRVGTWRTYTPVVNAYETAADRHRLQPAELQAITWLTWKRLYPVGRKRNIRRKW